MLCEESCGHACSTSIEKPMLSIIQISLPEFRVPVTCNAIEDRPVLYAWIDGALEGADFASHN